MPCFRDGDTYLEDKVACFELFRDYPEVQKEILRLWVGPDQTLDQYCSRFEEELKTFGLELKDEKSIQQFLKSYLSITENQAEQVCQENLKFKTKPVDKKHHDNCDAIFNYLLNDNEEKEKENLRTLEKQLGDIPIFGEGMRNDGGHFTFYVDNRLICDIEKNTVSEAVKSERIKTAEENLEAARLNRNKKEIEKAEKKLEKAREENDNPFLRHYISAIKEQIKDKIKKKEIKPEDLRKLAEFLAFDISVMAPADTKFRTLCGTTNCHTVCNVANDSTSFTMSQTFDKAKDLAKGEKTSRFDFKKKELEKNPTFEKIMDETYTEVTMKVKYTFKSFEDRSPSCKLEEFKQDVKFKTSGRTDEKVS